MLLVVLLAVPLLKLGRTLDEATLAIRKTHEGAAPLLADAQGTLAQVNAQLEQVEGIAKNVNSMTDQRRRADRDRVQHAGQPADQGGGIHLRGAQDGRRAARRRGRPHGAPQAPRDAKGQRMMRRLFWLAMGVTIGALVVRKMSKLAEKFTPKGMSNSIAQGLADLAESLRYFGTDVREAMAEREAELRENTGLLTAG